MDLFERAGIAGVRLNEIVAFTPTAATLQSVDEALKKRPNDDWIPLTVGERLYRDRGQWEIQPCLPTRSRSTVCQVLSRTQGDLALRLVDDGTSTLMRSREAEPEDLVADVNDQMPEAARFASSALSELAGEEEILEWAKLALDGKPDLAFPLENQPPYPVFEVELVDEECHNKLVKDSSGGEMKMLHQLLLYLVARNYRFDHEEGIDLERLSGEVLTDVLDDGLLLHESHGGRRLRNLSQGTRVFIAFGRRGTVVAHTQSIPSLPIRCSVLSMVETLRSRFHNLHLASTLMDRLLLRLARLMDQVVTHDRLVTLAERRNFTTVLNEVATASYIYGLAVTDPGAQLLDGSIISIIADRAAEYFELSDLRHACQRKMEAIRTIWTSYQDRRRQRLLHALRFPEHYEEEQVLDEQRGG
jgi:hypothetical protein